jgi:hypothetical protein
MKKLTKPGIPAMVLSCLVLAWFFSGCPQPAANGGGQRQTPQVERSITSAAEMAKIGIDSDFPLSGKYNLQNDITLSDWKPIGSESKPFTGEFHGGGKTITLNGFASAVLGGQYLGIFAKIDGTGAKVDNLKIHLNMSAVTTSTFSEVGQEAVYIGSLAAYVKDASLSRITVSGDINAANNNTGPFIQLGGICGFLNGASLTDSTSSANVTGYGTGTGGAKYNCAGGVVGGFNGGSKIARVHTTGDVSISGLRAFGANTNVFAGGILGGTDEEDFRVPMARGTIEDCSATGDITAQNAFYWCFAGGISGLNSGPGTRIDRCYATGNISAGPSDYNYAGGITAYNYSGGVVSQCYFTGNVDGFAGAPDGAPFSSGGIAGYNSQTPSAPARVEDCWSSGTVNAGSGIVGTNVAGGVITRCYSLSASDSGIADLNSIVVGAASLSACVALNVSVGSGKRICETDTANLLNNRGKTGLGSGADIGPNGLDGANCDPQPVQSVYEGLGWDFATVWKMGADGYPKLQWQP